jgi:predicted helicase
MNPNEWCEYVGDEKYILKLLLSVLSVSVKTMEIVRNLPRLDFID